MPQLPPYYEILTQSENINREGSTASISILVPWADRIALGRQYVGGVLNVGGTAVFIPGSAHPEYPGLFCDSVSTEPFGTSNDSGSWDSCKLTLSYSIPKEPADEDGQEIGDVSIEIGGEFMTMPRTAMKVAAPAGEVEDDESSSYNQLIADKTIEEANLPDATVMVGSGTLKIKFLFRTSIDPSYWSSIVGHINDSTFYGFGSGQVLFLGASSSRKMTSDRISFYSTEYNFALRPDGKTWNQNYVAGEWIEYVNKETGEKNYKDASFSNLLAR